MKHLFEPAESEIKIWKNSFRNFGSRICGPQAGGFGLDSLAHGKRHGIVGLGVGWVQLCYPVFIWPKPVLSVG